MWRATHDPERNAAALSCARRTGARGGARRARRRIGSAQEAEAQRAQEEEARRRSLQRDTTLVELGALLDDGAVAAKEKLARIKGEWVDRLRAAPPEVRALAVQRIQKKFDKPNVKALRDEVLALLA